MKLNAFKSALFVLITLSILIMASGLLCYKNITGLLSAWNQSNKLIVYLTTDISNEAKNKLITQLKLNPSILTVDLIDRAQAGLSFQNTLKEFSAELLSLDEMTDLIPESLEIDLQPKFNTTEREEIFIQIEQQLKTNESVDEVNSNSLWNKKFKKIDGLIRGLGGFSFLVILISVCFLITLMLRIYIEESRAEIEIYGLLGATRWSIYQLFLKDIFIFISASLALSFALLYALFEVIKTQLGGTGLSQILIENLRFFNYLDSIYFIFTFFVFIYTSCFFTIQSSVNRLKQLGND